VVHSYPAMSPQPVTVVQSYPAMSPQPVTHSFVATQPLPANFTAAGVTETPKVEESVKVEKVKPVAKAKKSKKKKAGCCCYCSRLFLGCWCNLCNICWRYCSNNWCWYS
jgi:hypothetical protein